MNPERFNEIIRRLCRRVRRFRSGRLERIGSVGKSLLGPGKSDAAIGDLRTYFGEHAILKSKLIIAKVVKQTYILYVSKKLRPYIAYIVECLIFLLISIDKNMKVCLFLVPNMVPYMLCHGKKGKNIRKSQEFTCKRWL